LFPWPSEADLIHKIKILKPKTMTTMHSVITPKSAFILPHPGSSKSQRRSASTSPSKISLSLLQTDALPSSGLDFLLELHLRRETTDTQAQKMTRKEHSLIHAESRKRRSMIIDEALQLQ
jgi:hypothetical protein